LGADIKPSQVDVFQVTLADQQYDMLGGAKVKPDLLRLKHAAAIGSVSFRWVGFTLAGLSIDPGSLPHAPDTCGASSSKHDNPPAQSNNPFPSQ